ncbi:Tricarboxylate transport protein TctB [Desulfosporosinus sp. I2]|uniref:tripartite tricarboxylate transporter TctB family protein n=1 Tax=Desulfosporosinus sp. I2 TaxID=1617025 RepID=UPI0005EF83D9|nr:tripartite tricarboxylate transporter TctB family protein [Desulfosporosinus sp. I2]KJR48966.1 Tricarboxylate transport protein TctB [Desulfosporosinus sp. I2]
MKQRDMASPIILMAFSLFFLYQTLLIKKVGGVSVIGSGLFPQILLTLILIISAANVFNTWRAAKKVGQVESGELVESVGCVKSVKILNHWAALSTIAMLIITVVLSDVIGFLLASGLFLFFFSLYMTRKFDVRNLIKLAIFAVIVSVTIHYAFVSLLQLTLPSGILF